MKYLLALFVFLTAFCGTALLSHLYQRTDDLSLRYNLWKLGLWPYPDHGEAALVADRNRDDLVRGKTKDELKAIFPDLHEGAVDDYQQNYEKWDIKGREHLWLGDGWWLIYLENGRGKCLALMKG